MNRRTFVLQGLLAGCLALPFAATSGHAAGDAPAPDSTSGAAMAAAPAPPLLLDPSDMGLGATVVFSRVPGAAEVHDLAYLEGVNHIVLQLPAWPADLKALMPLTQFALPEGADLIVILPGYPQTNEQAEAWNLLRRPLRIFMVVDGPPVDRGMIFELNSIHGLERVIADMEQPSRSGFERLQRPLSFRVVMP